MLRPSNSSLGLVLLLASCLLTVSARANDREQDGLNGPVRRVRTETAKLTSKGGKMVEDARVVLETATYDIKGAKVDNAYFLAAGGSLTGKEVYRYDDRGNITEMSLFKEDGTLVSKETYSYEFDAVGNWTKMTTSVAIIEGGKVTFEPTEVTYRIIAYYMDEATINKLSQAASSSPVNSNTPNSSTLNNTPNSNTPAATGQSATASQLVKPTLTNANAPSQSTARKQATNAPPELGAVESAKMGSLAASVAGSSIQSETGESSVPQVRVEGEAPVRPSKAPLLKPVSGGVLNGKAVSLPAPIYPQVGRQMRVSGMVTVEVVIDVTGRVISARAVSGPQVLYGAAEKAALQARFSPTILSGQPIKMAGTINYNFAL